MNFDEALAFWEEFINASTHGKTPDRLKDYCRYCGGLLQHGHIYDFKDGFLHRGCYLTILDFLRATPEQRNEHRKSFEAENNN